MSANKSDSQPKKPVAGLQADAIKMMGELSALSTRLRDASQQTAEGLGDEAVAQLNEQLSAIQDRLKTMTADSEKVLGQLDKSIRANPYVYLVGALGLGVLLGKALRS